MSISLRVGVAMMTVSVFAVAEANGWFKLLGALDCLFWYCWSLEQAKWL